MVFADSVAYPFRVGFAEVYKRFARAGLTDDVTFVGGGKLGIPENAIVAFALGVDVIQVGREAMMSIGCIQAQKCHTDRCPTGVATQDAWLQRGLDPELKSVRAANYLVSLRRDLVKVSEAVGVDHPGLITPDDVDLLDGTRERTSLGDGVRLRARLGMPGPRAPGSDRRADEPAGLRGAADRTSASGDLQRPLRQAHPEPVDHLGAGRACGRSPRRG